MLTSACAAECKGRLQRPALRQAAAPAGTGRQAEVLMPSGQHRGKVACLTDDVLRAAAWLRS